MAQRVLTPKQSAFIEAWLVNGYNVLEAYRTAYDAARMNSGNALREAASVINSPLVAARIQELRNENPLIPVPQAVKGIIRARHTPDDLLPEMPDKPDKAWLLKSAVDLWRMAKHTGNLGNVKSALELIGKITGDLVERKEFRVVRTWEDLTDAEVDALAAGETIEGEIAEE